MEKKKHDYAGEYRKKISRMSPERLKEFKERRSEYDRNRFRSLTREQRAIRTKAWHRWYDGLTDEQYEEYKARERARRKRYRDSLTGEQLEQFKERRRQVMERYLANRTQEQIDHARQMNTSASRRRKYELRLSEALLQPILELLEDEEADSQGNESGNP